jgi:hypothetical protein
MVFLPHFLNPAHWAQPNKEMSKLNTDQTASALWKLQVLRLLQVIGFLATGLGGANLTTIAAFLDPQLAAVLAFIVGPGFLASKPLLQILGDWADDGQHNGSYKGLGAIAILLVPAMFFTICLSLSSCAGLSLVDLKTDPDSCHLVTYKNEKGQHYSYGPCTNPEGKIDRIRSVWTNPEGVKIQYTLTLATKKSQLRYLAPDGTWIEYSSKSGVSLGNMPPQVEKLEEAKEKEITPPLIQA